MMFKSRTIISEADSTILFQLFEFCTLSPHIPELVVHHHGKQYLKIPCERELPAITDIGAAVMNDIKIANIPDISSVKVL